MSKASSRGHRNGPIDPQELMAQRARERGVALAKARKNQNSPAEWGLPAKMLETAANDDRFVGPVRTAGQVELVVVEKTKAHQVVRARRSNAFESLYAGGGLTVGQYEAGRRYFRAWCLRAGVVDRDGPKENDQVDRSAGHPPAPTNVQIDAGREIAAAHAGIGRASARLLTALVDPLVTHGEIRVWRVLVERATGKTNPVAQAAVVQMACEDLRLHYEAWDPEERARKTLARIRDELAEADFGRRA